MDTRFAGLISFLGGIGALKGSGGMHGGWGRGSSSGKWQCDCGWIGVNLEEARPACPRCRARTRPYGERDAGAADETQDEEKTMSDSGRAPTHGEMFGAWNSAHPSHEMTPWSVCANSDAHEERRCARCGAEQTRNRKTLAIIQWTNGVVTECQPAEEG